MTKMTEVTGMNEMTKMTEVTGDTYYYYYYYYWDERGNWSV